MHVLEQEMPKMLPPPTHFLSAAVPGAIFEHFLRFRQYNLQAFSVPHARLGIVDRLRLADALVALGHL